MKIDWSNLEKNSDSKELSFESFNFQIAWIKYASLGDFNYDYNTPGAEFFLTLRQDFPEYNLKTSDVLGWQAKFWVNHNDFDNTQMNSKRRDELKEGLKKALKLEPNLKMWFICTPGQIETQAKRKLEEDLRSVMSDLKIKFWNKPIYEAFYHESHSKFNPVFSHYFSSQFIGYEFLKYYTQKRINKLKEKFDTDLYVSSATENEIDLILDYKKILLELNSLTRDWQNNLKYEKKYCNQLISNIDNTKPLEICLSELLKFLVNFGDEFHKKVHSYKKSNNVINALNNVLRYVDEKINEWNELIKKYQTCEKDASKEETNSGYNLNREANSQYKFFHKTIKLYHNFFQFDMHIFGKAGYGKTNLACAVCKNALGQGVPALLLLASDIRVEQDIHTWIIDSLQTRYDFKSLLGFINNLGFLKQRKIPIVIDGLNEKYPDASYWKSQLKYLIEDVKGFRNILLITTSRESYTKEIFDKQNYKDVPNNYYLEGFVKYDLSIAINKYFSKYMITINNDDYDKSIFQHPLLLKIFCTVYGGKTFTFYPTNIYETMASYYEYLIDKIAESFPGQKEIMCKVIEDRIDNFCLKLLDNKSKQIDYKNDFFDIFDPDFSPSFQHKVVISDKILDEGMFIKRKMLEHNELVEFTHDFIGGYSIAKAIALSTDNPQEIINKVKDESVMKKVINLSTGDFQHPLSEDILKNLIYFFKRKTGRQLSDELGYDSVLRLALSMLDVADLSEKEHQDLIDKLLSSANKSLTISFFEETISNIVNKNDYGNVAILLGLIQELSAKEIDLYWSETIRKNTHNILKYLNKISDIDFKDNAKSKEIIRFLPCLFSSTNRLIRDTATKVMVNFGDYVPDIFYATYRDMEDVADLYIHERVVAALCGVILRTGKNYKETCLDIAGYMEKKYFQECSTTHLLILDFVDTILHYVSTYHGYIRQYYIKTQHLTDWLQDNECIKSLTGDGKATWGYGPIRMDFAKYTIGHHIASHRNFSTNLPSLKEVMAMIIWRMKEIGYDEKLFEEIDRECAKSRHDYSRHGNSGSVERYGKKYSWVAYFELYGQFVLRGKIKTEVPGSFRVSSIDIDPTFPVLPKKEQLVTECFLPRKNEILQAWVNRQDKRLLQKYYTLNNSEGDWILLNCENKQENEDDVRIVIDIDAIMLPNKKFNKALNILKHQEGIGFDIHDLYYYYLFNGEIPWGRMLKNENIYKHFDDSISFYSPINWFSWESYHSRMNDIGNVPFLAKEICDEFGLRYDVQSLTFFDKDEAITKYYRDNSSRYYYIKGNHLNEFLKKNKLSLVWMETIYKYGDFGIKETKNLNPSYNEIMSITTYKNNGA